MVNLISAAYGTISDIELMWTLIALVGLCFSLYNIIDARGDLLYLSSQKIANGRVKIAQTNFLSETARTVKQFIFLTIGIAALFLPEVPNTLDLPDIQVALRFLITWGMIVASLLTTFQSYLSFRIRRSL